MKGQRAIGGLPAELPPCLFAQARRSVRTGEQAGALRVHLKLIGLALSALCWARYFTAVAKWFEPGYSVAPLDELRHGHQARQFGGFWLHILILRACCRNANVSTSVVGRGALCGEIRTAAEGGGPSSQGRHALIL